MDMNKDMDEVMETWTRTNMDEDMETWTRTWQYGRGHGNIDENMETWTRTCKYGRGYGDTDKDMETMGTWRHGRMENGHGDIEFKYWGILNFY
jgi:hypothetical protein